MSKKYFYSLIANAAELKELHGAAVAHGKLEVGLSRGKILYAWDEERQNIKAISQEEASERLGLTVKQIDQIKETNAEVVFEEEKQTADATFQDETVLDIEPLPEEDEPIQEEVAEPVEELPTVEEINAPVDVQEAPASQPEPAPQPEEAKYLVTPLTEFVDDFIAALDKFKNNISN